MTKISCTRCNGTGHSALSRTMERTLSAVDRSEFKTTSQIRFTARVDGEKMNGLTALNNRLNLLLKNGLLEMREVGRTKTWKRAK